MVSIWNMVAIEGQRLRDSTYEVSKVVQFLKHKAEWGLPGTGGGGNRELLFMDRVSMLYNNVYTLLTILYCRQTFKRVDFMLCFLPQF